ncbi:hypothetical protein [Sphingomonas sp. J315]|uniref:hypothetical protein n=1 Tax=Sphingomonas sp. J315 TaxID=2898433 RepID=UPI0021ADFB70|nr:hypothetical protein [Sphingomonas sp. J315]UUX99448.1 hypothetical protein LRS08_18735 [Sphingomonas sp. J315]
MPAEWFKDSIEEACREYPFDVIEPILSPYATSQQAAEQHWPWVAFALQSYRKQHERGKDTRDITPARAMALLGEIARHADGLDAALRELGGAAGGALANGNRPKFLAFAKAHRAIVSVFDDASYRASGDLDPDGHANFRAWTIPLWEIARTSEDQARMLGHDDSASSGTGQRLPGLGQFISLCAPVWTGATGRKATAERVVRKDDDGDGAPDFIIFLRSLCALAALPSPSLSMVKTALSPPPLPNRYERLKRRLSKARSH